MMNRSISFLVFALVLSVVSFGQEKEKKAEAKAAVLKGYVVDAMCAGGMAKKDNVMDRAAKHTKDCALDEACVSSGYGVFADGKWVKFDEVGDKKALALIEGTKSEKELMVEVSGKMQGDIFAVNSIKEVSASTKKKENTKKKTTDEHKN